MPAMNRLAFRLSQLSAAGAKAGWASGFPIIADLRRELFNEFARATWTASRNGTAETHIGNPQPQLTPVAPDAPLPPPSGSHAAGLRPPGPAAPVHQASFGAPATVSTLWSLDES